MRNTRNLLYITVTYPPRTDVVKLSGTTQAQRDAWRAAADAAGLPLAAWLREAADAAALGGVIAADLRDELMQLRADLTRGVGNNLNQVARALNTDLKARRRPDDAAHAPALVAAADELLRLRRTAEKLLRRVERAGQPRGRKGERQGAGAQNGAKCPSSQGRP